MKNCYDSWGDTNTYTVIHRGINRYVGFRPVIVINSNTHDSKIGSPYNKSFCFFRHNYSADKNVKMANFPFSIGVENYLYPINRLNEANGSESLRLSPI